MKKMLLVLLASLVAVTAFAAKKAKTESEQPVVTQAMLAEELAKALGLMTALPTGDTDQQRFAVLMQNGICPVDGWVADKVVTKGDLARVLVQAMGLEDEVENPEAVGSWIRVLQDHDISLDSHVGDTVMDMEAIPIVVSRDYMFSSVDPLVKDDLASGAYVQYAVPLEMVVRALTEMEIIRGEVHPAVPTPH